ncbi:MAG: adhesin HecA-like repeat protein [Verrucomicrobiales bacterium]|jgi:adhesin HecA-like repeat protein
MQIEPSLSYYQMMMPHTTNLIDLEVVATSVSGTIDNRQSTIDNRQSTIDNRQSTIDNRQSLCIAGK